MVEIKPDVHPLLAALWITDPDIAFSLASREARRSGRPVVLPTLTSAFETVDVAMSELQSHGNHNEAI
jgi:hypothetical protein